MISYIIFSKVVFARLITQLLFICSKSPTETLEKGVKYIQNVAPFSSVSIDDFEQASKC